MSSRIYSIFYLLIVVNILVGCGGNNTKIDSIAPKITLNGSTYVELMVGDDYIDPGAIAYDNIDGNITNSIIIKRSVDTAKIGTYSILYSIVDRQGNRSSAKRKIVVKNKPNQKPIVEAGTNKTVFLNKAFNVVGSAVDSDGEVVAYKWKDDSKNIICYDKALSYALRVLGRNTFIFEAEDDMGAVSNDNVIINSVLESEFINQEKFEPIIKLIRQASAQNSNIVYITAGDSKRDYIANYQLLYTNILSKLHIGYRHNALSGISAQQWVARTDDSVAGIAKTVKDASGDKGSLTIVEYSLGANDWNSANSRGVSDLYAAIYPHIKKGITEIQKRLPYAKVFLVNPIGTYRPELKAAYRNIANELNLPMMENPMDRYRDNPDTKNTYFRDNIHPNETGAKRLVYNILYNITDTGPQEEMIGEINKDIEIFF